MKKFFLFVLMLICFCSCGVSEAWQTIQKLEIDLNNNGKTETISVQILAEANEKLGLLRDDANEWRVISSEENKILYSGYLYGGMIKAFQNGNKQLIVLIDSSDSFVIKRFSYSRFFHKYFCKTRKAFNKFSAFNVLESAGK